MSANVLGEIGDWVASCVGVDGAATAAPAPPCKSFRNPSYPATEAALVEWRAEARQTLTDALLMPALPALRAAATSSVEVARASPLNDHHSDQFV